MQKKILVPVAVVLFSATLSALAYVLFFQVLPAAVLGLFFAVLPLFVHKVVPKIHVFSILEMTGFVLLLIVAAVTSYLAYAQALSGASIPFQSTLPLLLSTVGLYAFYLLLNRVAFEGRELSVPEKLSALFSGPPLLLTLAMAFTVSAYVLLALNYLSFSLPEWKFLSDKFLERGVIPPVTLLLFSWGLLLLINKSYFIRQENRALAKPERDHQSTLLGSFYQNMQESGLSEPDSYFELVWRKSADFYVIPRYLNWAIPILGFIGTVLGISLAADGIQRIFNSGQGLAPLSSQLGNAISPLGIAFDTTLIALSLSVVLMLFQTVLQRWEDNLIMNFENRIRNLPMNDM